MVGVFVKGGKMPESCYACEYGQGEGVADVCPFYNVGKEEQEQYKITRHPACPLKKLIINDEE